MNSVELNIELAMNLNRSVELISREAGHLTWVLNVHLVNNLLFCLPPVENYNLVLFIYNICFDCLSVILGNFIIQFSSRLSTVITYFILNLIYFFR